MSRTDRWARTRTPATLVLIAAMLLGALTIAGVAMGRGVGSGPTTGPSVALILGCLPVGVFLLLARPANRVGLLLCLVGLTASCAVAATAWSATALGSWAEQWAWWTPWPLLVATMCVYPEGRAVGPTRRRLKLLIVLAGSAAALCLAVAVHLAPGLLLNGEPSQGAARSWLLGAVVAMVVSVGAGAWAVGELVLRARRAGPPVRSQLTALLPAGVLVLGGILIEAGGLPYATVPGLLAVPIGMGVAILAHHLDDLDLVVNRTLVWLVLTGCLFTAFAGTIALLSTTALAGQPLVVSALGTAVVAVAFDPARRRVQRAVNRLLFGDRDRPLDVLTELGRRTQASADPAELLAELVSAIGVSLRVPYVRMEVHGAGGQLLTVVEEGRPQPGVTAFPMLAHGQSVGVLGVAPRRLGEQFTPREAALLADIAGQSAIAARSYRVTLELRQARQSLVRSREEERLRIRRDLHDGLGPAIAGARMQVAAARQPLMASELLASVQDTLTECSQEVRRLVDGLRPGALDRGLLPAIEHRASAVGPVPTVVVEATGDLAELDAAVEVAVFRIVTEALSNAARHSGASRVRIVLDGAERQVEVEVRDDGRGGVRERDGGVGMESMRQRAEELGGRLTVESDSAGTSIRFWLPR